MAAANLLTSTQFARPLRAAAVFIAVASTVWQLGDVLSGGPEIRLLVAARAFGVLAAIVVAAASSPRRSVLTLQWLTMALALAVVGGNNLVTVIDPNQTWACLAVQIAITLGSALFIPWSWRWQAALASAITVIALTTIALGVPRSEFGLRDLSLATLTLLAVTAASALGADLADRERRRMLQSEALYRSLFESAGDAIAVLDEHGVIQQANARLATMLGLPLENIVSRPLESFQAAARGSGEYRLALSGGPQLGRSTLLQAGGRKIEVEVSYARTAAGAQVQAIIHDLTQQHALQRSEIKDQRHDALGQLAGGIAHQFNNLLGGIMTHAGVLRGDPANAKSTADLDEIITAARRGRELTQELLRFTKSAPLSLRPTSAGLVLESVAALARSSLPDGVTVDVRGAPDLPPLQGDPDHLVHACLELVLNARDAMQGMPNGKLTLTAAVEDVAPDDNRWGGTTAGRYIRLSVTDSGRGMDAATRDRAFEPFFTTKPMHRAAGIGLPKVSGVIRDHHGAIRVDSTPGRGTTVHLLLPVAHGAAAATAAAPTPIAAPAGPATILIVDDEAIVRHSLRRALTKFGYRVVEAGDGPGALAALQGTNPPVNLVILDLVLPGGGAGILELLRAVRPDIKVLVSSGYSPEADTVKDLVRRVEGFLPKPYEMSELQAAVRRALAS